MNNKVARHDLIIVHGDFNAKIIACEGQFKNATG